MPDPSTTLRPDIIAPLVHWIRHEKVILDFDLASLYRVEARALNQAVKRNLERFPADFLFQLTAEEAENVRTLVSQSVTPATAANSSQTVMSPRSRSQPVILKRGQNIKYLPYAFTEQGVAMLSSVLRSQRAVAVNIAIMRTIQVMSSPPMSRPFRAESTSYRLPRALPWAGMCCAFGAWQLRPTDWNKPAQGNALGRVASDDPALKGRNRMSFGMI